MTQEVKPYGAPLDTGDICSIAGCYADGTREHSLTPPRFYAHKPEQRFRVVEASDLRGRGAVLQAIDAYGNDMPYCPRVLPIKHSTKPQTNSEVSRRIRTFAMFSRSKRTR